MGGKKSSQAEKNIISILLVDDIPENRENIKKLLSFEQDFKVIGTAGTGREGVEFAKQHKPDIIIMDINMPDMDGLQATEVIDRIVPWSAIIIMSVQNDSDYYRRAMNAGAKDFLTKPINMDEMYNTIRNVYKKHEHVRIGIQTGTTIPPKPPDETFEGERAGHVIVVYSPVGGVGKTTIATSIASGLMKEDVKVLLIDADLQFADVGTFLNLTPQSTITEVAEDVNDLDIELFENVVATHDSGLKVLTGPARPEFADALWERPETISTLIQKVRGSYDFVVVDTGSRLDSTLSNILENATRVLLVGTPTLVCAKNMRFVLDLFDQAGFPQDRTVIVLNKIIEERKGAKTPTIPPEKFQSYLKRTVIGILPLIDERLILGAINRGVPFIGSDRDVNKPLIKQLHGLSDTLFAELMTNPDDEKDGAEDPKKKNKSGIAGLLGR
ncbi:MAG: response regulator [Phototrophicales bacterium]|nr:response regulator [Phototrophicales bacterium]